MNIQYAILLVIIIIIGYYIWYCYVNANDGDSIIDALMAPSEGYNHWSNIVAGKFLPGDTRVCASKCCDSGRNMLRSSDVVTGPADYGPHELAYGTQRVGHTGLGTSINGPHSGRVRNTFYTNAETELLDQNAEDEAAEKRRKKLAEDWQFLIDSRKANERESFAPSKKHTNVAHRQYNVQDQGHPYIGESYTGNMGTAATGISGTGATGISGTGATGMPVTKIRRDIPQTESFINFHNTHPERDEPGGYAMTSPEYRTQFGYPNECVANCSGYERNKVEPLVRDVTYYADADGMTTTKDHLASTIKPHVSNPYQSYSADDKMMREAGMRGGQMSKQILNARVERGATPFWKSFFEGALANNERKEWIGRYDT